MKKLIIAVMSFVIVLSFAGCKKNDSVSIGETVKFESPEVAYDAMAEAVENGKFEEAVVYYNSGAADAGKAGTVDMYFYSKAMAEYNKHGCIGYPLDMLMNNLSDGFDLGDEAISMLMEAVRNLNGVYEFAGVYVYIADGKVYISEIGRVEGTVFCSDEILIKDDVLYVARRDENGSHEILYTLVVTDNGIRLESTDENDSVAGDYVITPAEFPQLVY